MKNIKKFIAILLVATISYPNLIVQGDNIGSNDISNETQQEIQVDYAEGEEKAEVDNQEENSTEENLDKEEIIEENTNNGQNNTELEITEQDNTAEELLEEVLQDQEQENTVDSKAASKRGNLYETVKLGDVIPQVYGTNDDEGELKPEVIEKRQAMMEYRVLVPMTDAEYEIALAHDDGSYTYLDNTDTMEDAINQVEELRDEYDNNTVIPSVISQSGQVVYSTNSMGRMLQHRDGKPHYKAVSTTNVHVDSAMKNAYTYISMDYIDDLPIIEDNGKSAKVRVNGYDGWINRDVASGNYEMIVIPMNQVTNPSFYYVQNGFLYHYITTNMTGQAVSVGGTDGNRLRIGVAPDYLKSGVKYFSYDGNYFYQGNTVMEGLNKLINDLKGNTTANAVNPSKPNYSYFQYLPFRTRSNYTAAELDKFINENTVSHSKLRGIGSYLIEAQNKYGVNPIVTLGVAINESNWGKSDICQAKNNLFGLKAYDSNPGDSATTFAHPGESVIEFAKTYISRGYADPADWRYYGGYVGNKGFGANVKYASDPFWGEKAARHAFTVDYYFSGNNINNLRDYNGYRLAKFTGTSEVRNANGTLLYIIAPSVVTTGRGGFKENIVALKFEESTSSGTYQIFSERNTAVGNGGSVNKYHGNYNWNDNGYVKASTLQFVNTPKTCFIPGYAREDVNKNGEVASDDLSKVAEAYNQHKVNGGYRGYMDLNEDHIIDIFDLVNISKKLK